MSLSHEWCRRAVAACAVLLCGATAQAAGRDCTGYDSLKDNPKVESGKIGGDTKTFFVKSEMDDKSCPAATGACRRKAFLVPGNGVLVSGRVNGFACATYVNAKGVETNGWLPATSVVVESTRIGPDLQAWTGVWVREEAKITIKTHGNDGIAIHGDATFGSRDPQRVKNGTVNIGEISGVVVPTEDRLGFAMGDNDKTLPVDKGDDGTCKVWMRRVGDYLLVDDNNACGGMNVSFRGTYARP